MKHGTRADVLLNTMMVIDIYSLGPALNGLTQEEMDWVPHPGAWGVCRRDECTTPDPLGAPHGEWVCDNDWAIVEAANDGSGGREPMATIGWLLNHFGDAPGRYAQLTIVGGPVEPTPEEYEATWSTTIIPTVDDAVARVRDGWSALDAALRRAATDEQLEARYEGHPWHQGDLAITAMLNEVAHHATQVCMLRDLYHHRSQGG